MLIEKILEQYLYLLEIISDFLISQISKMH